MFRNMLLDPNATELDNDKLQSTFSEGKHKSPEVEFQIISRFPMSQIEINSGSGFSFDLDPALNPPARWESRLSYFL